MKAVGRGPVRQPAVSCVRPFATAWSIVVVLLLLVLTARGAIAQSLIRVLDRDSIPVPYAMVSVAGAAAYATDSTGRVRMGRELGVSPRVRVRRIGYAAFDAEVGRRADGEYWVTLDPVERQLAAVRTVAPRNTPVSRTGFYDRMERVRNGAITGWFISPEELDDRHITQVSRAVQGVGSVRVTRDGRGRPMLTGRGGCGLTVLLDGHRLNGVLGEGGSSDAPVSISRSVQPAGMGGARQADPPNAPRSIDELVEGSAVMAIEIYPSLANAPDELIPLTGGGGCGIIALWTGPRH